MSNRFVFVAPAFNASKTLSQMLHSICGQSYGNWKCVITDDASDPEHLLAEIEIIRQFWSLLGEDNKPKLAFHGVTDKRWEVSNVLTMIRADCEDEDIVCRIDADDWLTDLDALTMIDAVYEQTGCDLLWTAHRWGFSDKNISADLPQGADPYKHPWVTSHLKTFRKRLLNGVQDDNYRGQDGEYFRRIGDQAIYLPALVNSQRRVFLPRVMYHYTINDVPETYQTDDARFQRDEALYLRQRGYIP